MKFPLTKPALRVAAITTATFLFASFASAYVLEGPKWSFPTVNFQFRLGLAGKTLSDGNTSWDTAALPAPDNWNQNLGGLRFVPTVNPNAPLVSGDGVNAVGFASKAGPYSFDANTLAITVYYSNGSNRMTEADVYMNNRQTWDSYRGALRYGRNNMAIAEVRRVLIHELGHDLGLDHPDQHHQTVDAIMNAYISNRETVSADDIRGAQSMYGQPATQPTPTPVPTATPIVSPTPNPGPVGALASVNVTVSPNRARRGTSSTFTFALSSPAASDIAGNYAMSGGEGSLYRMSPSGDQVTIPAGESTATVRLSPIKKVNRGRSVTMFLQSGVNYTVGNPNTATLTITK